VFGGCKACDSKHQMITDLLSRPAAECIACVNHKSEIEYLRSQIERLHADWQVERAEFKRTVDSLIEQAGARPVGQGAPPQAGKMPSMNDLVGLFEEEVQG